MKSKILSYFNERPDEFVSGEKISKDFQVSRAAIWKHMQALKAEGYDFESQSRRGYRLKSVPDRVSQETVFPLLQTKYLGRTYYYINQIDSTNQEAKKLANEGAPEGTIIIAEEQSMGKGRLHRGWYSPAYGGMWLSMILRPTFLPQDAPKMTLLMAVAIAIVLNNRGIPGKIKWPNDILLDGKKIVGILTEISAEIEQIHYIVVGVGLNINIPMEEFPEELHEIATSLSTYSGKKWLRSEIVVDFLLEVEILYEKAKKEGFEEILDLWRKYSITLGSDVRVISGDYSFDGKAIDIDPSGALWVEKNDGSREMVQAGDVSIRSKVTK